MRRGSRKQYGVLIRVAILGRVNVLKSDHDNCSICLIGGLVLVLVVRECESTR